MPQLGKLKEISDLREIWSNEAHDFTPWLAKEENIALLSDAIGIDITVDETESDVGDFSADILGTETGTDKVVVIENQLEETNHDHLGKIITYAAGKGASYVIWIVREARPEHAKAIEWLNENTVDSLSFFLCEIKLYRIGDSVPAVLFNVIEEPNDWARRVREPVASFTETELKRIGYWDHFQDYAFKNLEIKKNFHRRNGKMKNHWLNYFINSGDCYIALLQQRKRNQCEIEFRIRDNKDLFHKLLEHKVEIEKNAGEKYAWEELPNRKASIVRITREDANFGNESEWKTQFDWYIKGMLTMKKVFSPYL